VSEEKEERMNATRSKRLPRRSIVAVLLLGAALSLAGSAATSPGLVATDHGPTASLDFSAFPDRGSIERGGATWQADGWTRGGRCLQLIRPGASLDVVFEIPAAVSDAHLTLVHRSAVAPGCPVGGFAPVTVSVNGTTLAWDLSPEALSGDRYSTDRWEIASRLVSGRNRIWIVVGCLCSLYEIQRLELVLSSGATDQLEAYQMTHAVAGDRPTDHVTAFASTDARATCWTEVAPDAIGRAIEFRFYDPSGALYFRTARTADRYNWGYIRVAGWGAADRPGHWHVDVYVASELQARIPFTIGPPGTGQRPAILGVEFPSRVPANGERTHGWVTFLDPDGDISWVTFEAVDGIFSDFEFDPEASGRAFGRFDFYVYTALTQRVRLKVVLFDQSGNKSDPYYLTFEAE